MQLVANLSLLFTELPMVERLGAARRAGFDRVEIQFPYDHDIDDLVAARDEAGVELVLINLPAGDRDGGEAGLTALPGREREFRQAVDQGLDAAIRLGARKINVLAGKPGDAPPEAAARTARENYAHAAERFAGIGATVLVEPVNPFDVPGFFLTRLQAAMDMVSAIDRENAKLMFDLYHMAQTEPSLPAAIRSCAPMIAHVQFADTPGRHEPGTGRIDFAGALRTLRDCGYDGHIAAEYRAKDGNTPDSLGWIEEFSPFLNSTGAR